MVIKKVNYILLIVISGIFAILYNEYITAIIFIVIVLLPLVLLLITEHIKFKLEMTLETTAPITQKDELLNLSISLKNKTIFPVTRVDIYLLYYNEYIKEEETIKIKASLDRGKTQRILCKISSSHCGNIMIKIKKIYIYDYFYIWKLKKKKNQEIKIGVIPNITEGSSEIIESGSDLIIEGDCYSKHKAGDDSSEVFSVREYIDGDRLSRIHWKLSYKKDNLMVKEFSQLENPSVILLLDLPYGVERKELLNYTDALLETILSISYSYIIKGCFHYLAWWDSISSQVKKVDINNVEDMYSGLDSLLKVKLLSKSQSVLLESIESYQQQYTRMVYITSLIKEEELCLWIDRNDGVFLSLIFINYLDVNPIKEDIRNYLDSRFVELTEIDIKR